MSSLNVVPTAAAGFVFTPNTWNVTGPFSGVNTYAAAQGCAQWRFDFWGEQLEVRMISGAGANPLTVSIDGGSLSTPAITSGVMGYYNLATGLSLGWHSVVVRTQATASSLHLSQTDGFRVTASDNNPQVRLSTGYKTYVALGATGLLSDGKLALSNQFSFAASQSVGGGFRADRFKAKTTTLPVYFVTGAAETYVQVRVDGTIVGVGAITNPSTSGGYADFVNLASLLSLTLDDTTFHEYEVEWCTNSPSGLVHVMGYGLSLSSGAQDTTASYTARDSDAYVGDSIIAGYLLATPFLSWPYLASRQRGGIAVTSALSASREEVDGPTLAAATAAWAPYEYIWNEYGTNDMSHHGTSTPASSWSAADIDTLDALLTASPSATILRLGILPRSSYDATVRGNWNGTGLYGVQYNMTQASDPSRIVYIDPLDAGLVDPTDYTEVSPAERLHPNAAGNVKLAAMAFDAMNPPPPGHLVEVAFDSGYLTPAADRTWTDVTDYVEAYMSLRITRGRQDEQSTPAPSRMFLTLDNRDGNFTPEHSASDFYPNVKIGRPIRVRHTLNNIARSLFTGYVDEWPVEWPGGSEAMSHSVVPATSRKGRLGKGLELRSILEEETLFPSPVIYFPLGEPQGATEAGNIAPGRSERLVVTQVGTGGTLTFGAGTGPGTDDLTAPVFAAVDDNNGLHLRTDLITPVPAVGDTVLDVSVWFVTEDQSTPLVYLLAPSGAGFSVELAGGLAFAVFHSDGTGGALTTGANTGSGLDDGLLHHVSARLLLSGGNLTASLILDGGSRVSDASPLTSWPAMPSFTEMMVGRDPVGGVGLFSGTIAHVAVYSGTAVIADSRFVDQHGAGTTGFEGETSGERIERYARLAGIPDAEVNAETGLSTSIAHKDTTGQTAISLMEDVALTEDGVVFDAGDGTLTFHARDHRYGSTSAFTLDCESGEVEADLRPRLDDQGMENDVTATRDGGATARAVNEASVEEFGPARESYDLMTTDDNEVQSRADWQVYRFGTPRVKIPNVRVALHACDDSLQASLISADIGDRFTLDNLPTQAPTTTQDFFIEGITHDITDGEWYIEFNVSPVAYSEVWILDSATASQLDETTVFAY